MENGAKIAPKINKKSIQNPTLKKDRKSVEKTSKMKPLNHENRCFSQGKTYIFSFHAAQKSLKNDPKIDSLIENSISRFLGSSIRQQKKTKIKNVTRTGRPPHPAPPPVRVTLLIFLFLLRIFYSL